MDAERKAYQIEIISMDIKKRITWWETEFGEEEEKVVYDVVKPGNVDKGKL